MQGLDGVLWVSDTYKLEVNGTSVDLGYNSYITFDYNLGHSGIVYGDAELFD